MVCSRLKISFSKIIEVGLLKRFILSFLENELDADFKESFYSVSRKNVLRGMHFQLPPHDHAKLVYVVSGTILDVALDIRKESKTLDSIILLSYQMIM